MNMKRLSLVAAFFLATAIMCSAKAAVLVDEFDAPTLDPLWTVDDSPASYAGSGAFVKAAGHLRFNTIYTNGYGHIETAVDTTNGARVDAILRDDTYATSWGMGAGFYFDANNWVSMKMVDGSGGANDGVTTTGGWMADRMVGGTRTATGLQPNNLSPNGGAFLIGGVELTSTDIKFWGSPITGNAVVDDRFGVGAAGIDANVSVLLTIPRPAAFTGNATAIIGKGFTDATFSNPDFDNIGPVGQSGFFGFAGIDLVRITTTPVPEPSSILVLFGLSSIAILLSRWRN